MTAERAQFRPVHLHSAAVAPLARDMLAVFRERYVDVVVRIASLVLLLRRSRHIHLYGKMYGASDSSRTRSWPPSSSPNAGGRRVHGVIRDDGVDGARAFSSWSPRSSSAAGAPSHMLDFALFDPARFSWEAHPERNHRHLPPMWARREKTGSFADADLEFMTKVLQNSGTGEATAWPPGSSRCRKKGRSGQGDNGGDACRRPKRSSAAAWRSSSSRRASSQGRSISWSSTARSSRRRHPLRDGVQPLGMRSTLRTYNLSGKGCPLASFGRPRRPSSLHPTRTRSRSLSRRSSSRRASTTATRRSMLLQNTLFRSGGAAVALTNKASLIGKAKYRLRHARCDAVHRRRVVQRRLSVRGRVRCSGVRLSKEIVGCGQCDEDQLGRWCYQYPNRRESCGAS